MTRLLKTIWYTLTGRAREEGDKLLFQDLHAIRHAYDVIIRYKQVNIQNHKNAIGQLIAIVEGKKNSLNRVNDEIDGLKSSIAKLLENKNEKVTELQESGISDEELNQQADYIHIINLHNEFVTTLEERTIRSSKLNREIQRVQEDIKLHKDETVVLYRSVEKLKSEQKDAVEDLVSAREYQEIAETVTSIKAD